MAGRAKTQNNNKRDLRDLESRIPTGGGEGREGRVSDGAKCGRVPGPTSGWFRLIAEVGSICEPPLANGGPLLENVENGLDADRPENQRDETSPPSKSRRRRECGSPSDVDLPAYNQWLLSQQTKKAKYVQLQDRTICCPGVCIMHRCTRCRCNEKIVECHTASVQRGRPPAGEHV